MVKLALIVLTLLLIAQQVSPLNLRTKKSISESTLDEVRTGSFKLTSQPSTTQPPLDSAQLNAIAVMREGLSGAFAGSVQVLLLMWLRTTVSYQHKYGLSLKHTLRDLYKQGGVGRFYKGVGFAMLQAPLAKFFSVASNDLTLSLSNKYKRASPSTVRIALFTALGGVISSLFRAMLMPIDTCKTVLQVDGADGFQRLKRKVLEGNLSVLYQGTLATIAATFIGHYPWYAVHNYLQGILHSPSSLQLKVLQNAGIAFMATAASDVFTNSVRVIKTVKQTSNQFTYTGAIQNILTNDGYRGLFGRGMLTRLISNSIQSILFTVVWKLTSHRQQ
mmetsp:Transcript_27031/g.50535  ORF Transcript_27031/g.50535 Transcript_27031/m.50535 type:complete len:332 (+) Transcript_27031:192-1187(+)